MTRADLPTGVGRTGYVAGISEEERVTGSVFVALADTDVVADAVRRALWTSQGGADAVESFGYPRANRLALSPTRKRVALADRRISLKTAYTTKVAGFAKTVCTGRAGNVTLLRTEGF